MKWIGRMLLRKGRFPADVRAELERERVVLLAEGIPGTVTLGSKRRGTAAALALTQQRLALYSLGEPLVDVTWDSGLARELDIAAGDRGLTVSFDAERVTDDRSGPVGVVLRIGDADAVLAAIDQRRRELPPRQRR